MLLSANGGTVVRGWNRISRMYRSSWRRRKGRSSRCNRLLSRRRLEHSSRLSRHKEYYDGEIKEDSSSYLGLVAMRAGSLDLPEVLIGHRVNQRYQASGRQYSRGRAGSITRRHGEFDRYRGAEA